MLEQLNSREFEEYCQLLLTCHYRCKVVLTKQTGDEGRDLLVYHSSGLEVVECKHWPSGTVGRPVVQKLHSAILTANADRGSIITTGRFSNEAETYSKNLKDVQIELIDTAKLAYLISMAFPNGALPTKLSAGIKTTPDAEFPHAFTQSIFSKSRYRCGAAVRTLVRAKRITEYETYFIATYHAEGSVKTAAGGFSESWDGSIWVSADGDRSGFGSPRSGGRKMGPLMPLAEVLRTVPGQTGSPKLQPHQAVAGMKEFIVRSCVKQVWYRGRNNRSYSATIQPSANTVGIDSVTLCYIPFQKFVLEVGNLRHEGVVEEHGSPSLFSVTCPSLSKCAVCGTATTADSQIFCSICLRPAHRKSLFFPDSFPCQKCGNISCRKHTVQIGKQMACTRCGIDGHPLGPRWLRHCQFGLAASLLIGISTSLVVGGLFYFASPIAIEASLRVSGIGFALALATWIPFLWMMMQASVLVSHKLLTYPMVHGEKMSASKPA